MATGWVKAWLPVPILLGCLYLGYRLFRKDWLEMDQEALRFRQEDAALGVIDRRPLAALGYCAFVLTIQHYWGSSNIYRSEIHTALLEITHGRLHFLLERYADLNSYLWWSLTRVVGYTLLPIALWKWWFPKDKILDFGLRTEGFFRHLPLYLGLLVVVTIPLLIVSKQGDFANYYPFYKGTSRSWFDLIVWEFAYFLQFLTLEFFFRGWLIGTLRRSMGSATIMIMCVPYCMIHYGKPYLEAQGAVIAGLVLGSLSAKTRSIYGGFLLHIAVALGMDFLALMHRGALPTRWFP